MGHHHFPRLHTGCPTASWRTIQRFIKIRRRSSTALIVALDTVPHRLRRRSVEIERIASHLMKLLVFKPPSPCSTGTCERTVLSLQSGDRTDLAIWASTML